MVIGELYRKVIRKKIRGTLIGFVSVAVERDRLLVIVI